MTLDLNKLENKLDEALSNETSETLNKFLNDKRMTNNKQQTAVEWFAQQLYERFTMKGDGKLYQLLFEQAKEMEKEQIVDAYDYGSLRSGCEEGEEYYNETYQGGDKWHQKKMQFI